MTPRRGSQTPRLIYAPSPKGFDVDDGADAVDFAEQYGLILDPWQRITCETWMRRTAKGQWCASSWGITVSRQNGKNGTLEAVELFGMVVLGLRFLHTAHEVKTARKAFARMLHFFDNEREYSDLHALVKEIRKTNGQEAIILHGTLANGQPCDRSKGCRCQGGQVEFSARSGGAARGFTVDVLVLDEAQDLTDDQLEALLPTISAAPSGDPATIYMGTPPKDAALTEEGKGAPFLRVRNGAATGKAKQTAWVEFSLDVDLEAMTEEEILDMCADRSNWAATNPALGRRILPSTIEGELEKFSPRSFARERLNVWPVARKPGEGFLDLKRWREGVIADVSAGWQLASIGLDMDPVTGRLWVVPCLHADDNGVHIELLPEDILAGGTQAATAWLVERARRRLPVVLPADSPATVLVAPLLSKRVRVYQLNGGELAQACKAFEMSIVERTLSHLDDPVLEASVRESERDKSKIPGQYRFKRDGEYHAAPLYAAAAAAFGAMKWSRRRTGTGKSYYKM